MRYDQGRLDSAAHSGDFGLGSKRCPTAEQLRAGNYAKGHLWAFGLPLVIETPMYQPRCGKDDGKPFATVQMAHYGYIRGTKGADGDEVDCFVGPALDSELVFVVNQLNKAGEFDEHKVMLGFLDEDSARMAYLGSYEQGWKGLGSIVPVSLRAFKRWLKTGASKKQPFQAVEGDNVKEVKWTEGARLVGADLADLMYQLRAEDAGAGAMLDSMTMADIEEMYGDGMQDSAMLDALVAKYRMLPRKMEQLRKVMANAGQDVKCETAELSKPFKSRGTTQVAALFQMTDGQTVTVFFHNPDSTPNKLRPDDELVSWKWMLNKKDVTIIVAPERGQDINPREVGRRIMKLVEKNSEKFQKANAAKAEQLAEVEALKGEVEQKTARIAALDAEIERLEQMAADNAGLVPPAADPAPEPTPAPAGGAVPEADALSPEVLALIQQVADATGDTAENVTRLYRLSARRQGVEAAAQWLRGTLAQNSQLGAAAGAGAPGGETGASGEAPAEAEQPSDTDVPEGAELKLAVTFTVNKVNRQWIDIQLGRFKSKLKLNSLSSEYQAGGTYTADLYRHTVHSKYGSTTAYYPASPEQSAAAEAAYRAKEVERWMGYIESTAKEREYFYQKGWDKLRALGALEQPEIAARIDAVQAELRRIKDERAQKWAIENPESARRANDAAGRRIMYAQNDRNAPAVGETVQVAGKAVRITKIIPAFKIITSDMPSIHGHQLLGFEGEKAAWHYFEPVEGAATVPDSEAAPAAGVDPEDEDAGGTIEADGRENPVRTAKGTKLVTGFRVIEGKRLIVSHDRDGNPNPEYPQELQPRDRARQTSQAWIQKTAKNLDPDSLGRTQRADTGAPIVGPDRVVESGNGRAMAILEAYRIGTAGEYREWLIQEAEYFGIDPEKVRRMKRPILVRVRKTSVDREVFAVEANQDDKLAMTATEKARSDAKRLTPALLARLEDGDLNSAANRDFLSAFLQSLGDAEAAQYLTSDGKPTASLIARVQAALFAAAYADDRLLELTADVAKPEIANIISALNQAAPDFIRAAAVDRVSAEGAGERLTDSLELALTQQTVDAILAATGVLAKAKESGMTIEEFLKQGDMFGNVDPAVAAMAVFIHKNNRSARRMATAFKAMARFVEAENQRKQNAGLFGDEQVRFEDVVAAANRELEKEFGEGVYAISQAGLFDNPQPPAKAGDDQLEADKRYLESIIDGTADLSASDVPTRLEAIYERYGEGELSGLFADAADAFARYALELSRQVL